MARLFRIGQIVPSSNTTMETEIPAMLRAREGIRPERFSFHSSRMRMKRVTRDELAAMDAQSVRCAEELADAEVDVMGYACLVAIMSSGLGYHRTSEARLGAAVREAGAPCPIVTSAGALVQVLGEMHVRRAAIITPYLRPLTNLVAEYIEHEGVRVVDTIALEIADNLEVGRRDPLLLLEDLKRLDVTGAEAVVLSACVQMPSLDALSRAEDAIGLPVVSAAACTARVMLQSLGLEPVAPGAGFALSPAFAPLPEALSL
ncbi:maleate cis-trans isomerase family protein [Sphingosinicella xenopeptidilytica]|uniref:Maleate isomerase n=1 Tax=Sphingosinicella xenopeptidilytica TaxID=364098 RepID=A0ABW3C241_SPHXN